MQALIRFFEFVRREIGADDVRGEVGGRDPGPEAVWATMPGGVRVVAIFDAPPSDLEAARGKLRALVESFASLGALEEPPSVHPPRGAGHELDEALDVLAQRARAAAAIVVDDASPVIWGSSLAISEDIEEALWLARVATQCARIELDLLELAGMESEQLRAVLAQRPLSSGDAAALAREIERARELGPRALNKAHVLAAQSIAAVREAEGKHGELKPGELERMRERHLLVRPFATIYRLLLVFDGPFSELHAEGALIHAMPVIERLVTALPPRDPVAGGAKVAVLRRLRRV